MAASALASERPASAKGIFVDNRWQAGTTGRTLPVEAPAEGRQFSCIAAGSREDIDVAVRAARRAREGAWGRLNATERGRLLQNLGRVVLDRGDELAALEARDTGKPLKQARADVIATARYFEFYGGAAEKVHGDTLPFLNGYFVATIREPYGVTGHIIPWNYPAQMFSRTCAPALAVGNACVVKPAEDACLSILRIAELAAGVGFPNGAINIVPGLGEEAGAALAAHAGIDFVAFTGSPEVGSLIQAAAARNHIGCTLELGGKSPQLIFDDADLEAALPVVVNAIVQNSGQTCSAGSRVLIQKSIYDRFVGLLADKFASLVAGTPEMDRDLGPVISLRQKARVERYVAKAKSEGVPLIAKGQVASEVPAQGHFVAPVLFGPVPRANVLAHEEVFGPVLAALPFEDEADGVRLANGTDYGLMAGVWTSNGGRQMRVAKQVRAGQVYINGYGAGLGVELPFGGTKKSGHGREKGFEALREYSQIKTIIWNHG
ncbi:MAG: aldehyde dehydrogenase family protein [Hyphomonadaceae bacterium]|nr:aldehyde dehydrogenase family protein [Hyphomonadaceae bacterium]